MNAMTDTFELPASISRPPIDGAQTLPIELLKTSPTNPRKHYDQAKLDELGANIKRHGLIQPVLVRPCTGARRGDALYEIVCGERRWRASKAVGEQYIAAIVRDMSDFEVIELQLVENLQREDLSALEEADGYASLLLKNANFTGMTWDELAARIGKSRSHIAQRLKLRELKDAGRMALDAGEISASVALLIARLPTESEQKKACDHVVQGWGGEPLSYRNAQAWIEQEFMLKLGRAPFKITDATLVPAAGSCRECPKRSGANPDLFNDVQDGDTCTDPACFHGKEDAHRERIRAEAEEKGMKVISGAEAKKAMPHSYGSPKGYLELDKVHHELGEKPLKKLLGKDGPEVLAIENPHTKDLIQVVREDEAIKALKAKGLLKTSRMPTTSAREREAEALRKYENAARAEAARRLLDQVDTCATDARYCDVVMQVTAAVLWREIGSDGQDAAERLMAWEHIGSDWSDPRNAERKAERIAGLGNAGLIRYFTACAISGELKAGGHSFDAKGKPSATRRLEPLLTAAGIDITAIRNEIKAEARAKAQTPAQALAKAVKKTAKKTAKTPPAPAPAAHLSAAALDPFRAA